MDSAPRKVPKRSKKRSIHFSQLEKKSKKKPFGFNKTSWILLALRAPDKLTAETDEVLGRLGLKSSR